MKSPMRKLTRRDTLLTFCAAAMPALAKIGGIEIGLCGQAKDFEKAGKWAFDYYEPAVAEIAAMSDADFASFRERVSASRLRCESFNSFIRTLTVVGEKVNRDALTAYLNPALDRSRQLGARIIVWGSAGSRNVPEGFSRDKAWSQIVEFLKYSGDLARSRDIVIAIEPLRKQESNIINTGAEALKLVHDVNHPNVKMIIDYYHLRVEKEDPEIVERARNEIVHFHFANPTGRRWPKSPDEDPVYGQFFAVVKKIGYRGRISIEGQGSLDEDATGSLEFFRKELAG